LILIYSLNDQFWDELNISDELVLSQAGEQGLLPKTGMFGADLNKEQWHEDPFGDIAQKVREDNGR